MNITLSGVRAENLEVCITAVQHAAWECGANPEILHVEDDYGEVRVRVELGKADTKEAPLYAQQFGVAVAEAAVHGREVSCRIIGENGKVRASWSRL